MQTYRRLASTATSTSRSASTASMHQHGHGRLSRSSSTTSTTSAMTPIEVGSYSHPRMAIPISRGLSSPTAQRNSSAVFASPPTHDQYTRQELETIAESLLAHVTFGPYHLASSPVPSSHLRLAMASHRPDTKENLTSPLSASTTSIHDDSSSTPTLNPLGPLSSQRRFEGKEGSHYISSDSNNHHPRARFTIGGGESERGRGMGRKSVGLSVRDVNHTNEFGYERERGRDMRGRSGNVKGLQYS